MHENKLGITDSTELARAEEKISKQKAVEMFETGFLEKLESGTYESLAMITNIFLMKSIILQVKFARSISRKEILDLPL